MKPDDRTNQISDILGDFSQVAPIMRSERARNSLVGAFAMPCTPAPINQDHDHLFGGPPPPSPLPPPPRPPPPRQERRPPPAGSSQERRFQPPFQTPAPPPPPRSQRAGAGASRADKVSGPRSSDGREMGVMERSNGTV